MKFYYNTIKIKHSSFRTVAPQQETMYIYLSAKKKAIGFNTYKFISPMAPLRRSRGQTNTQSRQPQTSVASTKVSHQYLVYYVCYVYQNCSPLHALPYLNMAIRNEVQDLELLLSLPLSTTSFCLPSCPFQSFGRFLNGDGRNGQTRRHARNYLSFFYI